MEPPEKRVCYEVELKKLFEQRRTGWFDLPYEIRKMILDMVPIDPLLRFGECSRLCYLEVLASKNYFKELQLIEGVRYFTLKISPRFSFEFWKEKTHTEVVCKSSPILWLQRDEKIHWREYVEEPAIDVVLRYLDVYLQKIGGKLEEFHLNVNKHMRNRTMREIQLRNLRNLESLRMAPSVAQICSIKYGFLDFEQCRYVTKVLEIPGTRVDLKQLVQFKAETIGIYYMGLTPDDLIKYLKLWRDGKLHRNFRRLQIHADYDMKSAKRRIELNVNGLECEDLENTIGPDVTFKVRSSCEWLKDVFAHVWVTNCGMLFSMQILKNS